MKTIYKLTGTPKFDNVLNALDNHIALSGKSYSTRKAYTTVLYRFLNETKRLPEECTKNEIIAFLMWCKQVRNFGFTTMKHHIYAIKYYLYYIADRPDLYQKIPNPSIKIYNINVLTIHEIQLLFEKCKNIRELLIIQMLYETGMRVSELANLSLPEIDLYHKTITIRNSKNKKTRVVNIGDSLITTLTKYLESTPSLFSESLFTRQYHPFIPMSSAGVNWVINALVKRAGITKRVNLHSLRHTFAVHYLNFGGTIYRLQKLLGHKTMVTTINYLQYANLHESKNISILDKLASISTVRSSAQHYTKLKTTPNAYLNSIVHV